MLLKEKSTLSYLDVWLLPSFVRSHFVLVRATVLFFFNLLNEIFYIITNTKHLASGLAPECYVCRRILFLNLCTRWFYIQLQRSENNCRDVINTLEIDLLRPQKVQNRPFPQRFSTNTVFSEKQLFKEHNWVLRILMYLWVKILKIQKKRQVPA